MTSGPADVLGGVLTLLLGLYMLAAVLFPERF